MIAELSYRFYLFGPSLHYQGSNFIDEGSLIQDDKEKVFFVGDSFTKGFPYPISLSYPNMFEEYLGNDNIKITNFAVEGTTLHEQVNIIRQISVYKPTFIIWGLSNNDICAKNDAILLDKLDDYELTQYPIGKKKINQIKRVFIDLPYDCMFRCKMGLLSTIKEVLYNYSFIYGFLKERLKGNQLLSFLEARDDRMQAELTEATLVILEEFYKKNAASDTAFQSVFDAILYARNMLDREELVKTGFYYVGIGRGA